LWPAPVCVGGLLAECMPKLCPGYRENFGYMVKSGGEGALYSETLSKSLANCSGGNREAHVDVLWVITRTAGNSITKSAPKREVVSHRTCEREILKYTHNVFPTSLKAHARLHQVRRKKGRKKEFKC
jgi:hypothetical protein